MSWGHNDMERAPLSDGFLDGDYVNFDSRCLSVVPTPTSIIIAHKESSSVARRWILVQYDGITVVCRRCVWYTVSLSIIYIFPTTRPLSRSILSS